MKRKGITPVIAVVLLLLITVGAVASAWGLYQQLVSGQSTGEFDARQKAQKTGLAFNSVYKSSDGYVMMDVKNTGERAVNVSNELGFKVIPEGSESGLPLSVFRNRYNQTRYGKWYNVDASLDCFSNTKTLTRESTMTCNTTVEFPQATQSVGFTFDYEAVDSVEWSYMCNPQTSSTVTC